MVCGLCLVGVVLFVLLGCFLRCLPLFFVAAWWNRGIADEVTIASFCKAVTGTAVMARSANEEKKKKACRPHQDDSRNHAFCATGASEGDLFLLPVEILLGNLPSRGQLPRRG